MHEHKKATSVAFVSIRPFAITNSRLELIHSFLDAGAQIYVVANLNESKPQEKNILDGLTAAEFACITSAFLSVGPLACTIFWQFTSYLGFQTIPRGSATHI